MTAAAVRADLLFARPSWAGRLITRVLRHPVTMRLKPHVRAAGWAVKGAGTRNPELPARVESVLFVCLGNICRSPFAAALADRLCPASGGRPLRCSSAGIRPSQAARSPEEACRASERYGLSLEAHRPRLLTPDLLEAHDLVVVMEWRHFTQLREAFPGHRHRIVLLSLFDEHAAGAYERYNIADPFGHPLAAYEACYVRIERALRVLFARAGR